MKRLLTLLLCLLLFALPAIAEESPAYVGVWIETDGYGTLTIRLDGTATMVYYDGTSSDFNWEKTEASARFTDGMWYNSPMVLLDENTLSVSDGWMVFAREGFLPTTDQALLLNAVPVGEEGLPFLGEWELTAIIMDGEELDPALFSMSMLLTFFEDGTVTTNEGWEDYTTTWFVSYGNVVVEGDILTPNEDGQLVLTTSDGQMVFTRVPTPEADTPEADTPEADTPAAAQPVPVGEEGAPYLGQWTLTSLLLDGEELNPSLFGMTMSLTFNEDGTVLSDDGFDSYTATWIVADGAAVVDGEILHINADGLLVMDTEDGSMIFSQGEAAPEPVSEEDQLMALLALLMQSEMEAEEELSALPEEHRPFVGEWYLCYCQTGGLTGDLRSLGITGTLTLNADYTGTLTGIADETGSWYDDEGVVRFGESGMPMFLIDAEEDGMGTYLQYGTEQSGCMIFHQDADAVWTPGLYPLAPVSSPAASQAVPSTPSAPAAGNVSERLNRKFVCTQYTSAGFTMDAAVLGAEYALFFQDDGTVDFTLANFTAENLPYTVTEEGIYAINYYGTFFNCMPTEAGFDMDYYGTMTMHFVPAE